MVIRDFILPQILVKEEQPFMLKKNMKYLKELILKSKMIFWKVSGLKLRTKIKKTVCGCIYRHPNHDTSEFSNYLESLLKNISSENKEVYICGDFNIDLLKLDIINNYQQYYNLLCSFGFLPLLIVQPTRVVENQTPSLIDNIFF